MRLSKPQVGYVLKRYPRYSETFIINEMLAHEAAGIDLEIFSLRAPTDIAFPEQTAQVRANVNYLPADGKAGEFWAALADATGIFPDFREFVRSAKEENATAGCQAMVLASWAKKKRITHLHAHFASSATTVARLAAGLAGLTYSFTAHAKDIFHDDVDDDDLRRKLTDASAVVTVSDFNVDHLKSRFGSAADRVQRIYNGLELALFPFSLPEHREPLIVAVGRLVEKKGFADLLDACKHLAARGRRFACQIVGGGECQEALAEAIQRLGLSSFVRLMGPLPQSEVVRLVQRASVLAAPCVVANDGNRDGLPTVLLEAMASGTPCVSTDVTGIPEIISDGETGLLVGQRNPAQLAIALDQMLTDANLRIRLARNARRRIERSFNIHLNSAAQRAMFETASYRGSPARQWQHQGVG